MSEERGKTADNRVICRNHISRGFVGLLSDCGKSFIRRRAEYEDQEQEEDKEIAQNDSSDEKKDSETSEESSVADSSEDADDDKTPAQIMDADDGYIFPDVGSAYLDEEDIKALTTEEIQYAINEVYARHGLKFTKQSNKERFEKKKWYTGTVDDQDDIKLNQYEKKNVDLMADILEQKGAR